MASSQAPDTVRRDKQVPDKGERGSDPRNGDETESGKGEGQEEGSDEQDDDGKDDKGDGREDDGGEGADREKKPKGAPRWLIIAIALVLLANASWWGWRWWTHGRLHESTDNAYVEAAIAMVGPRVQGQVLRVHVEENAAVEAGALLLELDPVDFQAARDGALAALRAAEARAAQARAQVEVAAAGVGEAEAQQQMAEVEAARRAAEAEIAQAAARLREAELNLSHTRVVAPFAGRITNKRVEPGDYVSPGASLIAMVADHRWVEANFKEIQLTDMRPGQPVTLTVDAFPDQEMTGRIESLQRGTGSRFAALPPQNATGNWVKMVQRVPVRIALDEEWLRRIREGRLLVSPGMSAEVEVRVR